MGCDSPGPMTPEENRRVQEALENFEAKWQEEVDAYKEEIRDLLDSGFRGNSREIAAVIIDRHQPSEEQITEAVRDIILDQEYGMPDGEWRISKQ